VSAPYWEATADGRLELQRCRGCDAWVHYPRASCPRCHSRELEPRAVTGRGRVYSWTTIHTAGGFPSYGQRVPYTIVLVELEEGPRMIGNLVDGGADAVAVGDPVEVVFEERGELKLPQFVRTP
jgi:uncharacterized OB-fold protein